MKLHDIEWEQLGTHNPHLSVLDYKKKEREREVYVLENKVECTEKLLERRKFLVDDIDKHIDNLEEKYQEKLGVNNQLDEDIVVKSAQLDETTAILAEKQTLLETTAEKVSQIKAIDNIEYKKSLIGNKITMTQDDYTLLSDLAKKQASVESKENKLAMEISQLKKDKSALENDKASLKKERVDIEKEKLDSFLSPVVQKLARKYRGR